MGANPLHLHHFLAEGTLMHYTLLNILYNHMCTSMSRAVYTELHVLTIQVLFKITLTMCNFSVSH